MTCCPISRSGFRPEINDKNKMASAEGSICNELPGKRTTGIETFSLMCLITSPRLVVVTKLPPTKKKSTQFSFASLNSGSNAVGSSTLSGSTKTAIDFFLSRDRLSKLVRIDMLRIDIFLLSVFKVFGYSIFC